jgi:hypothetical protein
MISRVLHHYFFGFMLIFVLGTTGVFGQTVGIGTNTPNTSSVLDIQSPNKGLLIPRMTAATRTGISSPANGLLVYDTDFNSFWYYGAGQWFELGTGYGLKSVNGPTNFISFPMNPRRYIWELNASHPVLTTIEIPLYLITELCGDDDGCNVILTMSNWQTPPLGSAASSITFRFFYNASTNVWRVNDGTVYAGTDGNSSPQNIGNLSNNIYFTDGFYAGTTTGNDTAVGFGFLKWNTFTSNTVGRLILED